MSHRLLRFRCQYSGGVISHLYLIVTEEEYQVFRARQNRMDYSYAAQYIDSSLLEVCELEAALLIGDRLVEELKGPINSSLFSHRLLAELRQ